MRNILALHFGVGTGVGVVVLDELEDDGGGTPGEWGTPLGPARIGRIFCEVEKGLVGAIATCSLSRSWTT
jgi:hypothetical protein